MNEQIALRRKATAITKIAAASRRNVIGGASVAG